MKNPRHVPATKGQLAGALPTDDQVIGVASRDLNPSTHRNMTHEEKWRRLDQIDARLKELQLEAWKLQAEKTEVLMTRASDEDKFFIPWSSSRRKAS